MTNKPKVAIHKFSSCDGCQLAFINAGEDLLTLANLVDLVHFAEAGAIDIHAEADIAFIEGSISTPDEKERIQIIRQNSRYVITIGACATSGGLQALRNSQDSKDWMSRIYASPQYIKTLATATQIKEHIRVDYELWGCPVNPQQVFDSIRFLLYETEPKTKHDAQCIECKRKGNVCVLVTKKQPCMGPVTQVGCGSLCPTVGRGCYACFGPQDNPNTKSLGTCFKTLGLSKNAIEKQFMHINSHAPAFEQAGNFFKGIKISHE